MVCLDTSFIIDLFRNKPEAYKIIEDLEHSNSIITVASLTIIELMTNTNLNQNKKEKEDLMKFFSSVIILNLDKESAISAAEIESDLIIAGEIIGIEDIMIGAIAKQNNEILITKNKKHFERIQGLKVESY